MHIVLHYMSKLGYYIYAIRGKWMDRFKIGFYIADLYELIKRYKTYYGLDIEVYVFEVFCSRKEVQSIEKHVHKVLINWIIDASELYLSDCIDTFIETACTLTNNSVTIPLKKNCKKSLKKNKNISNCNVDLFESNEVTKTFQNIQHIVRIDNNNVINVNYLNTDPNKLPCCNGIIDLETGSVNNKKFLGIPFNYHGVNYPTSDINNFMIDIFNNDTSLINYVQKVLGYGITGNNNEQIWIIFDGTGGNGKGLLLRMIQKLMDKYYITAPDQIFYKIKKNDNGPTPYLTSLHNKRFVVKSEYDQDKILNEDVLKSITGQDSILSKNNYARNYLEFTPTVLPILSCNKKPKIKIHSDSDTRRIIVIPFTNTYAKINDPRLPYDFKNINHRLHNNDIDKNLMSDNCIEQLLTWLVNGSIKWYKERLNDIPKCLIDALKNYHDENDHLTTFINDRCDVSPEFSVNASDFKDAYNNEYKQNVVSQDDLKKMMKSRSRNFDYSSPYVNGKRVRSYMGIKLK